MLNSQKPNSTLESKNLVLKKKSFNSKKIKLPKSVLKAFITNVEQT